MAAASADRSDKGSPLAPRLPPLLQRDRLPLVRQSGAREPQRTPGFGSVQRATMSGHDEEKRTTVQCAVMLKRNLLTRCVGARFSHPG
jgi:hypothetical protein